VVGNFEELLTVTSPPLKFQRFHEYHPAQPRVMQYKRGRKARDMLLWPRVVVTAIIIFFAAKAECAMESAGVSAVIFPMTPAGIAGCAQPSIGTSSKEEAHDGEKIWRDIRRWALQSDASSL
jgi:hypothetical protein